MHIICLPAPSPPPPKKEKLHNFCFLFLLSITAVPRETENNVYAKFWGAIMCIMGDVQVAWQEQIHVIIIAYILEVQKNFI